MVHADGTADVTIPKNDQDHGYAMWGPQAPRGSTTLTPLAISPVDSIIPADPATVASAKRRITPIERVTASSATLVLTLEDENLDDNALVRIDDGSVNAVGTPTFNGGPFKGFQKFTTADPGFTGSGVYSATIDISKLSNGLHYIEAMAFLKRDPGQPPVFETFRKVIEVKR